MAEGGGGNGNGNGFEWHGFGQHVRARGGITVIILFVAVCTAIPSFLIFDHESKGRVRAEKLQQTADEQLEKADEMVYVLKLSPQAREKLNIDMPPSLRRRLQTQQDQRDRGSR